MSRRPLGRLRPSLLAPLAVAAALLLVSGCASDPKDEAKEPETTTTSTTLIDDSVSTTRPAIDPDDIDGGEQAYVDAFVASYQGSDDNPLFDEDQAKCLAPKWVSAIGVEAFAAAGVAPEDIAGFEVGLEAVDLDEATAEAMVAAIPSCEIDLREGVLQAFVPTDNLPEDVRACLETAITDEVAAEIFKSQLLGADSPPQGVMDAQACITQFEQEQATTTQPGG